ncbi:MAG: nuclear transport factor 2 family protein [Candidatus Puniceispirillaceae bacterium]
MTITKLAAKYADYFSRIAPDTLDELEAMLSDDVIFIDPFNKLEGKQAFVSVFAHMFEVMTNPHFEILDVALSQERAYLKWRMTGTVNAAPKMPFDIIGMSEIEFDSNGLVRLHHDHWDSASQLLSHLPYIGWVTGRISRLFAHKNA